MKTDLIFFLSFLTCLFLHVRWKSRLLNTIAVLSVDGENLACRMDVACFKVARAVRLELEEHTEKNEITASKDRRDKIMEDKAIFI